MVHFRDAAALWACLLTAACSSQTLTTMAMPRPGNTVAGVPYFLPRGFVPMTFTGGPPPKKEGEAAPAGTYKVGVAVGDTSYMADAGAPLFLAYQHSSFADDHINLIVDKNGLLQSTSVSAIDRGGAVALKVAELVGQIATGLGGLPNKPSFYFDNERPVPKPPPCTLPPFLSTVSFFPVAPKPLHLPTVFGTDKLQTLDISIARIPDQGGAAPAGLEPAYLGSRDRPKTGIGVAFRRAIAVRYRIEVKPSDEAQRACGFGLERYDRFATVPDDTPAGLYWQDTSRAPLVAKKVNLSVTNGMLTGVEIDNPSEALAIVSLPVDLLKSLLSIPASILTFKVQQMAAAQGVTDAELKALQSQIDFLQKQAALQKERSAVQAPTQQTE